MGQVESLTQWADKVAQMNLKELEIEAEILRLKQQLNGLLKRFDEGRY